MQPLSKKRPLENISTVNLATVRKQQSVPINSNQADYPNNQKQDANGEPVATKQPEQPQQPVLNKRRKMENPKKFSFQSFKIRKNLKNGGNSPRQENAAKSTMSHHHQHQQDEQMNNILEESNTQGISNTVASALLPHQQAMGVNHQQSFMSESGAGGLNNNAVNITQYSLMSNLQKSASVHAGPQSTMQPFNPLEDFDFLNPRLDQDRTMQLQENRKQRKLQRQEENTKKYTVSPFDQSKQDEIPLDWSIKNSIDIQMCLDGPNEDVKDQVFEAICQFVQDIRYYQYRPVFRGMNTGFQRGIMDQKQMWVKSCLDVYRRFLQNDQQQQKAVKSPNTAENDIEQPYFYIFNSTFMALFRYKDGGRAICQVVPSQALTNKLQENEWIQYTVEKLVDTRAADDQSPNPHIEDKFDQEGDEKESQEGQFQLQEILENLNEPINLVDSNAFQMDSRFFKLEMQKEYKVLTFEKKNVQAIFNIVINLIGLSSFENSQQVGGSTQLQSQAFGEACILSSQPFVNSSLKDVQILFKEKFNQTKTQAEPASARRGQPPQMPKLKNFDLKCCGFFLPTHQLKLRQAIQQHFGEFVASQNGDNAVPAEEFSKSTRNRQQQQVKVIFGNDNELARILSSKTLQQSVVYQSLNSMEDGDDEITHDDQKAPPSEKVANMKKKNNSRSACGHDGDDDSYLQSSKLSVAVKFDRI